MGSFSVWHWIILFAILYVVWRLSRGARPRTAPATIKRGRPFACPVVGESHYQDELERLAGGRSEDGAEVQQVAMLVLEDSNPYDSNAVCVQIGGATVGYLSRDVAKRYRAAFSAGKLPSTCNALIVGGWDRGRRDKGHFGVRLDLAL